MGIKDLQIKLIAQQLGNHILFDSLDDDEVDLLRDGRLFCNPSLPSVSWLECRCHRARALQDRAFLFAAVALHARRTTDQRNPLIPQYLFQFFFAHTAANGFEGVHQSLLPTNTESEPPYTNMFDVDSKQNEINSQLHS